MDPQTPSAPAPAVPAAAPSAPVVEKTLAEFRAEKAAPVPPAPIAAPVPSVPASPLAGEPEPPEPADEPDTPPVAVPAPEAAGHRWKDPVTGITLDLRRRDHRRIKRTLEDGAAVTRERDELRARLSSAQPAPAAVAPAPAPRQPQPVAADPTDPEPSLDQFADSPDPYGAHIAALARWHARQEHRHLIAQQSAVERTQRTTAAIDAAQTAFEAELPSVRVRYPDFDAAYSELHDTLAAAPAPVRAPIVHKLLTHPQRHDVAYYLGNHPEELQRLVTARDPHEQAVAMGEVIASVKAALKAPAPAPVNPPAAPMAPVNGGGTPTSYNPQTASLAEYRARHGVRGGRRLAS